jgi:predicted component of type VI protein secretion system
MKKTVILLFTLLLLIIACNDSPKNKPTKQEEKIPISVPKFDPDSAFYFVKAQTD